MLPISLFARLNMILIVQPAHISYATSGLCKTSNCKMKIMIIIGSLLMAYERKLAPKKYLGGQMTIHKS